MSKTTLKKRRNDDIKKDYSRLASETVGTIRKTEKYKHEAILVMLSEKYYLSSAVIGQIVAGNYKRNQ